MKKSSKSKRKEPEKYVPFGQDRKIEWVMVLYSDTEIQYKKYHDRTPEDFKQIEEVKERLRQKYIQDHAHELPPNSDVQVILY